MNSFVEHSFLATAGLRWKMKFENTDRNVCVTFKEKFHFVTTYSSRGLQIKAQTYIN